MRTRLGRSLLCACLAIVVLPAGAAAATEVTPPASGGEDAVSAAASDSGCNAENVIEFKGDVPLYRVRHTGLIRCTRNVRIRCVADLFHGDEPISHLQDRGDDRCRIGSAFSASRRYPAGDQFTQDYSYKLTLQNRRKVWAGTNRWCPRLSNERRTLTCRGSHTTKAPRGSVERIFE